MFVPLLGSKMIDQTERDYSSDSESYEVFVGQITPQDFVKGFENFDDAVKDFLSSFPYDEPIPSWLETSLVTYLESQLCQV